MHEFKFQTKPRRHDVRDVLVADVHFETIGGNAEPHFGITGGIYGPHRIPYEDRIVFEKQTYWLHSCGCVHDAIAETFPELAPFLKYHLSSPSGPMHYVANGLYHHKLWGDCVAGPPWSEEKYAKERTVEQHRKHFCDTILYDAEKDLQLDRMVWWDKEEMTAYLEERRPRLQAEFDDAMRKLYALRDSLCT